jgi:hypothetical protein
MRAADGSIVCHSPTAFSRRTDCQPSNWLMQHYTDQEAQYLVTAGARVNAEMLERRWIESGVL